jgi:polar amino acid transport system permease protein
MEPEKTVPLRHPVRWTAAAVVIAVAGSLIYSFVHNPVIEWSVFVDYLFDSLVMSGVVTTIKLMFLSIALGTVLGTLLAIMRLTDNPVLRVGSSLFIWLFRGTPLLVQLIFWYNLGAIFPNFAPSIPFTSIGFSVPMNELITPMTAAVLGLGLNAAAYYAEIARAGILSVDKGQTLAASALGLTFGQTMRRVVLPQALRVMVPPTGNEVLILLKNSALVSVIGGSELLNNVQVIYSQNFRVIELLLVACVWYLVLTTALSVVQYFIERRLARGDQGPAPLPGLFGSLLAGFRGRKK